MKKLVLGLALFVLIGSAAVAAETSISSPTCALSVSPTPIEIPRTVPLTVVWNSSGGDSAVLTMDAWSQPDVYHTTGLSGNVTVPVHASMGMEATLTVTKNNPYGTAVCKVAIPTFWIPKK